MLELTGNLNQISKSPNVSLSLQSQYLPQSVSVWFFVDNLMLPIGWGADLQVEGVKIKADLFSAMHKIQFTKSAGTHK